MTALKKVAAGHYRNENGEAMERFVGGRGYACMRWIVTYANGKSEGVATLAMARERLA